MNNEEVIKLDEKHVNEFCGFRINLLREIEDFNNGKDISALEDATKQYYLSHINKNLFSWGILYENNLVAIGSLCLFERIPYKENLTGLEGYILNIYTSPQYRKQGLANRILDEMIKYASKIHIKRLWLNSSKKGIKFYENRGFMQKMNEMELFLP